MDLGGYFEAKKSKLEEQFAAASNPFRKSNLFDGISIFVNGLTNPTADELKRIMMVHGGTFHHYERSHTKFIIASNLPDVKVRKMDTSRIIAAQWVVDCVEQNRVLDYKPYLLYTNQKTTQPRLNFGKGKKNDSTLDNSTVAEETELDGILKELQQDVATSPKKHISHINNLSATTTSNHPNSSHSARTAVDPEFLNEFYKNSRLHHIATLGAGFKQYVCELRQAHGNKPFVKRGELRTLLVAGKLLSEDVSTKTPKRYVMHIDMDCFFVSVGLRSHPDLRGLPIAVTHSKGGTGATDVPVHPQANRQVERELFAQRFEQHLHDNVRADKVRYGFQKNMSLSEIASCSYEARAKGIRNGMFVGQALKLCPELKTIPYDFEGYREVAFALYNTVAQYTLNIEAVSCDEMFVDLTDVLQELQVDVMTFVTHLRQEVRDITACPCSAGVADNKLLARMATKLAKPNGQHLLQTEDAANYMATLALDVLPGVGSSITYKLNQAGLSNCADVQQVSLVRLEMLLGKKMAQTLYQNCRGIDPRPLVYEQQRKSISAEVNYGIRFSKYEELEKFLKQLSGEVHSRLIEIKRKAKSITLKLMVRAAEAPVETSKFMGHGICDNQTKSLLLKQSTDDLEFITQNVLKLMKESGFPPNELRGIGIHLSKLDDVVESKKENLIMNMFSKISEKQKDKSINIPIAIPIKEPLDMKAKSDSTNVLSLLKNAATRSKSNPAAAFKIANFFQVTATESRKLEPQKDIGLNMTKKSTGFIPIPSGESTIAKSAAISHFDPDVLAQLPEELRREILNSADEYLAISKSNNNRKRKSNSPSSTGYSSSSPPPPPPMIHVASWADCFLNRSDLQPSTSKAGLARENKRLCRADQIVTKYMEELPQHMHPAIHQYITLNNKQKDVAPTVEQPEKQTNIFVNPNYKSLLATWVKTEAVPKPTDVNLIYLNICDLVLDNQMDKVYEIMKYFCCIVKTKRRNSCCWHMAYNEIESNIQEKVQEILDCHIYIREAIDCCKCQSFRS
ncbi:DNA repair protein Rev1 isoform X2 [Drosophila grimshawi]|uniref:DNA repair protein Rev1 isoform X2 n=1 Tax=Drosophila grimshawi TaxID=7222 RepID=UPI000C86EA91|nr:DNA repair protein Rev1 isoform X2 [Drosophila grimshawi]